MTLPTLADPPSPRRRSFQYSLRTLLILSLIIALFSAGIFSKYDLVRECTFLIWMIAFPSMLLAVVIYGHGYLRSFCIGALVPFSFLGLIVLVIFINSPDIQFVWSDIESTSTIEDPEYLSSFFGILAVIFLSTMGGLSVVLTRWMIDSANRRTQPPQNPPTPGERLP